MTASVKRGLVLGGGGILGATWMAGVLGALEDELGDDIRTADLLVGTSAGSVIAGLLAAGVSPGEMVAHQRGDTLSSGPLAGVSYDYGTLSEKSTPPAPGVGSMPLAKAVVRRPGAYPMPTLVAAFTPRGRSHMGTLPDLVDTVLPAWPPDSRLAICTMDYATGERRVFDGSGSSDPSPSVTIAASCAIAGWFTPVPIGGGLYVDGGSHSFSSVDVAAGRDLDEVYVLAPMAYEVRSTGESLGGRMLRWWRTPQTRRMYVEAEAVRRDGTAVHIIAPNADDLSALGQNPMDSSRRDRVLDTALRRRGLTGRSRREGDTYAGLSRHDAD